MRQEETRQALEKAFVNQGVIKKSFTQQLFYCTELAGSHLRRPLPDGSRSEMLTNSDQFLCPSWWNASPQHDGSTTMSHHVAVLLPFPLERSIFLNFSVTFQFFWLPSFQASWLAFWFMQFLPSFWVDSGGWPCLCSFILSFRQMRRITLNDALSLWWSWVT